MAIIINTDKNNAPQSKYRTYGKKEQGPKSPLFRMPNYILMGVGAVILFIGYIALSGGASDDPAKFSEAIFDTRRLVVAPILILIGLVTEIFAIMWHPRNKEVADTTPETKAE